MHNDIISAIAFISSKLLGTRDIYNKYKLKRNLYSYDGSNIYDFKRKGFITVTNKSDNELEIYDFINKKYLSVIRENDQSLFVKENSKNIIHLFV